MANTNNSFKTILLVLILGLIYSASAHLSLFSNDYSLISFRDKYNIADSLKEEVPMTIADQMPQYPGGEKELLRFIQANLRYPEEALKVSAQGIVYVSLLIDENGKAKEIKLLRSILPALDAEALRVTGLLSDWIPAKQAGKPVAMQMTIPVRFKIPASDDALKMPRFPGGEVAFNKFIGGNIHYPKEALKDSAKGTVAVTFSVNNQGSVEDVKVSRSVHPALDAEAVRVVSSSPEWTPGKEVSYEVPVSFDIKMVPTNNEVLNTDSVFPFDRVEEKPQFPGGERKMMEFIKNNLKYPVEAQERGYQGTVIVNFVVREDGKLFSTKVLKGIWWDLDAEALRIIKIMPDWNPGKIKGKPVKVSCIIPLKFVLH